MSNYLKMVYEHRELRKCNYSGYTSIFQYVSGIQKHLEATTVMDLIIKAGDSSDYRFRVQWQDYKRKHLHIVDLVEDWDVIIPRYMSPCFLKEAIKDINPWRASLVCDLANRICDSHHQAFYDWEDAIPMYVLADVVPEGWDDSECSE